MAGLRRWLLAALVFALPATPPALASALDLTPVKAWVDGRGAVSTAGREWLDGGFSKTRYGGPNDTNVDAEVAEATLLWSPRFTAALEGHLHVQAGPDQSQPFSAVEAFLRYRTLPMGQWRFSVKAGRFYPPISYEHDGPAWSLTRTITPSAINSWIGEEVIGIGGEARAARSFGDHFVDFRASAFGFNDTAGALLGYRGWALHDIKSVIGGSFRIPDDLLRRAAFPAQAERTFPSKELDNRVGVYASGRWRYSDFFQVDVLGYDNRADPEALENGQYGWRSRFLSLGLKITAVEDLDILVQGLVGETAMGPPRVENPALRKFDVGYSAAYILASYALDAGRLTFRADHFRTRDRGTGETQSNEDGWSATAAFIKPFSDHIRFAVEALYISHNRALPQGPPGRTNDIQMQTSLQLHY